MKKTFVNGFESTAKSQGKNQSKVCFYEKPTIEWLDVNTETGFAQSTEERGFNDGTMLDGENFWGEF